MEIVPGMLVRFRKEHDLLTLTMVNVDDPEPGLGFYTPKAKNPIGLCLRVFNHGGIFLFDDKTCYVSLRYFLPVINENQT